MGLHRFLHQSAHLASSHPVRVMVVEGSDLIRAGLVQLLGAQPGIVVVGEAGDGMGAEQVFAQCHPEVVLMDINLPDTNGIACTQRLRQLNPAVRVVVLTESDTEHHVLQSLKAGASAYCLKRTKPSLLAQIIAMVFDGGTWLDATVAPIALNWFQQTVPDRNQPHSLGVEHVQLTVREREVLQLMAQGASNKEIAQRLAVTIHTAKAHVHKIINKLGVDDRTQAALMAIKERLV